MNCGDRVSGSHICTSLNPRSRMRARYARTFSRDVLACDGLTVVFGFDVLRTAILARAGTVVRLLFRFMGAIRAVTCNLLVLADFRKMRLVSKSREREGARSPDERVQRAKSGMERCDDGDPDFASLIRATCLLLSVRSAPSLTRGEGKSAVAPPRIFA